MRRILLLLGTISLVGCDSALLRVPPPPIGERLTGEQIKSDFSDRSLVSSEEQVPPLSIFFAASEEMLGLRSNNYQDSGTWRVDNDTICGNWRNWYGTMSSCWEVYRHEKRLTLKSVDDDRVFSGSLTPGNAAERVKL
jgi:hypothetical protein